MRWTARRGCPTARCSCRPDLLIADSEHAAKPTTPAFDDEDAAVAVGLGHVLALLGACGCPVIRRSSWRRTSALLAAGERRLLVQGQLPGPVAPSPRRVARSRAARGFDRRAPRSHRSVSGRQGRRSRRSSTARPRRRRRGRLLAPQLPSLETRGSRPRPGWLHTARDRRRPARTLLPLRAVLYVRSYRFDTLTPGSAIPHRDGYLPITQRALFRSFACCAEAGRSRTAVARSRRPERQLGVHVRIPLGAIRLLRLRAQVRLNATRGID